MGLLASLHQLGDWALLVLRVGIGALFLVHGRMKMGMWKAQPSAQLPASMLSILRMLSIAEQLGGLASITGLLTQLAALGFIFVMLGAIRLKAGVMKRKFAGEGGWELDLAILVAAITMLVFGAGQYSLDRLLLHI